MVAPKEHKLLDQPFWRTVIVMFLALAVSHMGAESEMERAFDELHFLSIIIIYYLFSIDYYGVRTRGS